LLLAPEYAPKNILKLPNVVQKPEQWPAKKLQLPPPLAPALFPKKIFAVPLQLQNPARQPIKILSVPTLQ
jgi:hypothetical protein